MVKLSITHIAPPQTKHDENKFDTIQLPPTLTQTKKKDLIETLKVKFYINSWIYYSVALNVKCTPLFIPEHLLHYLLWHQLHHKWDSCRVIKHPGETHRKKILLQERKIPCFLMHTLRNSNIISSGHYYVAQGNTTSQGFNYFYHHRLLIIHIFSGQA